MSKSNVPQCPNERSTFIVEPLLPTREIHLIAGGSGAGKSTLACQIANALLNAGDFFGTPIPLPQKVAYLAFDRSEKGMRRTFERTLGTTQIPFPFYSTITSKEFSSLRYSSPIELIERILKLHPDTDVLMTDGIGMAFKGDNGSLHDTSKFIQDLIRMLADLPRELTIMALHQMSKAKKGSEYSQARQRLHGSVGWAATCETCILIEPEKEDDPEDPHRKITICPRQRGERVLTYEFDERGCLILSSSLIQTAGKQAQFAAEVMKLKPGEVTYEALKEIADNLGASDTSFHRWLTKLVKEESILKRLRPGVYKRLETQ